MSRSAVEFRAAGITFGARVVTPVSILVRSSSADRCGPQPQLFVASKLID